MGEGITKEDSIIHTLKWCNEKRCIDGQTTRTAPICPNPLQTDEAELGRVAGYSFYPYENGRDRDYAWEEYVDNEEYVWENHVPPDVVTDIEKVIAFRLRVNIMIGLKQSLIKRSKYCTIQMRFTIYVVLQRRWQRQMIMQQKLNVRTICYGSMKHLLHGLGIFGAK